MILTTVIFTAPVVSAAPPPSPMFECPNNSHVWNKEQCEGPFGFSPPKGTKPGCAGILCGVPGLGGLLGNLPGLGGIL